MLAMHPHPLPGTLPTSPTPLAVPQLSKVLQWCPFPFSQPSLRKAGTNLVYTRV